MSPHDGDQTVGGSIVDRDSAVAGLEPSLSDLWTPAEDEADSSDRDGDLGQLLLEAGALNATQLNNARSLRKKSPGLCLGDIFFEMGVNEETIQRATAAMAGIGFQRFGIKQVNDRYLNVLGVDYCRDHGVMPLQTTGSRTLLGVIRPADLIIIDEVRHKLGIPLRPVVICRGDITVVANSMAEEDEGVVAVEEIIADIEEDAVELVETNEEEIDLEKEAAESPIIRFVNYLIFSAVKQGASDIHIEPQERKLQIRYRIDGQLYESMNPPAHMHAAIISRLKIMSNLDISERRLPQDGRICAIVHGRKLDLRLSTLPTSQGEKAVLRILDARAIQVPLENLGMDEDSLPNWRHQINQPHGILLVTGPTGSGKTTTLYASIGQMDSARLNICTVEDPVEYQLNKINQTQIQEKIGMSFGIALRALLRQDPDVIMMGEIRDRETSLIAIQASLTGHLVLSTLHTNDAPSAVTRLINIGVEPYLIASAVNACLAQRLVRRICENCREQFKPDDHVAEQLAMHGVGLNGLWVGKGCDDCRSTGYTGRVGLYELLIFDDLLRDKIVTNPNVAEFRRSCIERGMLTLRKDGFRKVAAGLTTVDEVLRVTECSS